MWQLKTNTGLAGYLELALILTLYLSSLNSLRWECWAALWTTSVSQTNHCRESWLGSRLAAKNLRTKEGLWRGQNRRELTGLIYSPRPPHSHFHTPKSLITHVCRSDRVKRIVHVSALRASSTWCYSLQFLPAGKHFLFSNLCCFSSSVCYQWNPEVEAVTQLELLDNYELMLRPPWAVTPGYLGCRWKSSWPLS